MNQQTPETVLAATRPLLFIEGLKRTTATNAVVLGASIPVFTVAVALLLGRERATLTKLLGLGLVGQDHAVAEHVDADRLDVLGCDVAAVAQERVRARRQRGGIVPRLLPQQDRLAARGNGCATRAACATAARSGTLARPSALLLGSFRLPAGSFGLLSRFFDPPAGSSDMPLRSALPFVSRNALL
ncbi:hypothetical protein B4Q13_16160, partial [Lacticaseibacillus rhamnosus]